MKKKLLTTRNICVIGILSAIATLVMLFEFPLWFAPSFYKLDFSEIVVLIGAFSLGPVAGIIIEAIKILLNFMINGTTTAGIGELANFVIGCAYIVPAAIIYRRHKTRKIAIVSMIIGTLCLGIAGGLMNYFVLLPAFSYFMKIPMDDFTKMGMSVNGCIKDVKTLVLFATVPFNLIKGLLSSTVTLLIYKKIAKVIHTNNA